MLRKFFCALFHTNVSSTPPQRVPPQHPDGSPMTDREREVWKMLQKVAVRHRAEIMRMKAGDRGGFTPGPYFREEFVHVIGGSRLVLISTVGDWEATLDTSLGTVSVPRKIRN